MFETLFVGKNSVYLPETNSTNEFLAKECHNKQYHFHEGSVVYTFQQNKGKGQRGNVWVSENDKNLLSSYLFFPNFLSLKDYFNLNIFVSLAVVDTIQYFMNNDEKVMVKWPNDVYINNKKVAGILIENSVNKTSINQSIIGIGINVNQLNFGELNDKACSISQFTNTEIDKEFLLKVLNSNIEKRYLNLKSDSKKQKLAYLEILYQKDVLSNYEYKNENIKATIKSVADDGRLVISFENNEVYCDLKEIRFL
jgi:BirA family transcriptional regulator, biotin operon repressor / biotin---[acetyl-CoA-carboxylase] ligase